jgi:Flp pilus assembly protein TadB
VTSIMVLIVLAVVWAAVLLPPWLRNRSEGRPADSILSFRQQLSTLERTAPGSALRNHGPSRSLAARTSFAPRPNGAPSSRAEARRRRREVLYTLAGAAGITFLAAIALGGVAWLFFLLATAALGGYVALLVRMQRLAAEREVKVRFLGSATPARPEPAFALRRSASH